jgi:hypothetical protein
VSTYCVNGKCVGISAPVEIGHAQGHHWFSTLHSIGSDLLCEVVTSTDTAQGKWPGIRYLSRDAGETWDKIANIDSFSHTSVPLDHNRILLLPYEVWPLSSGDRRNAIADGTIITYTDGSIQTERTPVRFLGFERDLDEYNGDVLFLLTCGEILPLRDGGLLTTIYGRFGLNSERHHYECIAVVSHDGGFTWEYRSIVANWQNAPGGSEGPNESCCTRLSDGRLMCIYRIGSGHEYPYHVGYSDDEGLSWSEPKAIQPWSVFPKVLATSNGLLILTGGRPGLMLWICDDGVGNTWHPINLAEHHNNTFDDASLHFGEECVLASGKESLQNTTSYTGLTALGDNEVLVSYDRLGNGWKGAPGPLGEHDSVFTVRVTL